MSTSKLETMYEFTQAKLKTITNTLDLLPYINALMTFNGLKIQLSMALHQVYIDHIKLKINNNNIIQSLFLQVQRFNDGKNDLSLFQNNNNNNNQLQVNKPLSTLLLQNKIIDDNCTSVIECIALHRIIKALLYYDNICNDNNASNNNNTSNWIQYFDDNNYKYLLDDYHHILYHHLNRQNICETNKEFELIYAQITKYISHCQVIKCAAFRRNRRIRENEKIKILNNNKISCFYVDTLDMIHCYFMHSYDIGIKVKQNELKTAGDTLTLPSVINNNNNNKNKNKKLKVDDIGFYFDRELSSLKKILHNRLNPLSSKYVIKGGQNKYFSNISNDDLNDNNNNLLIQSLPRTLSPLNKNVFDYYKQKKFEKLLNEIIPHLDTSIVDVIKWLNEYINDEEFIDCDAIRLDLDDPEYSDIKNSMQIHFKWSNDITILVHHILKEDIFNNNSVNDNHLAAVGTRVRSKSTFSTSTSYDFGHKFYYWDEYRENNQQDYGPNIGYKKKDWYINKKYVNLKDELINNRIYRLDVIRYNECLCKSSYHLNTNIGRNMFSIDSISSEYYKIKSKTPVSISNIIVIVLYCDYIDLVFNFRSTFRPISDQETNEQLKNRHREYWNWSKILSETVELYGESICNSNINIYYFGVSFLLSFPNFISHFCGPTSTTSNLEVVTIFSDENGIILELMKENEYSNLKLFNCSWLSSYGNENEILFFGGYRPLKFQSIRLISSPCDNYKLFIKSLTLFNNVVKAKKLTFLQKESITKIDYKIIKSLMRHYMSTVKYFNKSPNYINNLFKSFCDSKKYINININWMNNQYPGFQKYLMCSSDHHNNMVSLEIIGALFPFCEEIVVYNTGKININYINKLIQQLKILNEQHRNILRVIKLCDVNYNNKQLDKNFEKTFNKRFSDTVYCKINVDVKVRLQKEDLDKNNLHLYREIPEYSHLIIIRNYKKYKLALKQQQNNNNILYVHPKPIKAVKSHYRNSNRKKNKKRHHSNKTSKLITKSIKNKFNLNKNNKNNEKKKEKQRSRSYHRNKKKKTRLSSLGPFLLISKKRRQLTETV